MKRIILLILGLTMVVLVALLLPNFKLPVGKGDFISFWSASYMLARGLNPYDHDLLGEVQRGIGWLPVYPSPFWNPPWLAVLLWPYTLVSFNTAAFLWLLTNIFLVFSSSILLWRVFSQSQKGWWIGPFVAFLLSPTYVAIYLGQVAPLFLWGAATFFLLLRERRDFWAGAALFLTTIKPQLAYIFLPAMVLWLFLERRWRALLGLGAPALGFILFLFWWWPEWLVAYRVRFDTAPLYWETPTLGGVVQRWWGLDVARYLGIFVLPAALAFLFAYRRRLDLGVATSIIWLVSLPTAIYGWGFDQILLLFPLIQMVAWWQDGRLSRKEAGLVALALTIWDGIMFYQRLRASQNELDYFWVPLGLAAIYLFAASRARRPALEKADG